VYLLTDPVQLTCPNQNQLTAFLSYTNKIGIIVNFIEIGLRLIIINRSPPNKNACAKWNYIYSSCSYPFSAVIYLLSTFFGGGLSKPRP
jgi:hypothetical protein